MSIYPTALRSRSRDHWSFPRALYINISISICVFRDGLKDDVEYRVRRGEGRNSGLESGRTRLHHHLRGGTVDVFLESCS